MRAVAGVLSLAAMLGALAHCTQQQARDAFSAALSAEQIACALFQADLGNDDPNVLRDICRITDALEPQLRRLLAGRKMAAQRLAATRDAGR